MIGRVRISKGIGDSTYNTVGNGNVLHFSDYKSLQRYVRYLPRRTKLTNQGIPHKDFKALKLILGQSGIRGGPI